MTLEAAKSLNNLAEKFEKKLSDFQTLYSLLSSEGQLKMRCSENEVLEQIKPLIKISGFQDIQVYGNELSASKKQ